MITITDEQIFKAADTAYDWNYDCTYQEFCKIFKVGVQWALENTKQQ